MDTKKIIEHMDLLIERADMIQIARSGGLLLDPEYKARCFHNHDETPTLILCPQTKQFHCIADGCHDHGDVISFTQRLLGLPFPQAVAALSKLSGTPMNHDAGDLDTFGRVRDCMTAGVRGMARCLDRVSPYLESRGISRKTSRRLMIGGCQGSDTLTRALSNQGFDKETMQLTGLLNQYGLDRFQNHLVVPIFRNGQVVDLYGRFLDDAEHTGKHWRLPGDRLALGKNLFNLNPQHEAAILVEGVFDALSLIENGFTNAVATFGTNGLTPDVLGKSCLKKVWICFDGDEPGHKRALQYAYELKDLGLDVRIIDLPDNQDPNEFFLTHSADDFRGLLKHASQPEKWEIDHLDPEWDDEHKIHALDRLMRRARTMQPLHREVLTKQIANKLVLPEKIVRQHIAELPEGSSPQHAEVIDLAGYELIHPALHYSTKGALMTIPLMGKSPKTGRPEWEPWVVTSERELFPLQHEQLNKRGWYCTEIICPGRQRYSYDAVMGFVRGERSGTLPETFHKISRVLRRYLDFSDPRTFEYLTAWIVGTYCFPMFNYYPYLHFTGTKEVGKSKAMKIMSLMCFNGIMSVSITDAAQFRIITELLPTLFLDESENLGEKGFSERRALLLGGYEKGSTAIRTEKSGETFRTREFDNFSPRVFASIEGLEDTLASRTVQIAMKRSYDEKIKEAEVDMTNPEFLDLRDELFLVAMDWGGTIRTAYEQLDRPDQALFDAREWNLFKPICAIGTATGDPEIMDSLIGFANDAYQAKTESSNDTAVENVILRCLAEMVVTDDWYEFDTIHQRVVDFIKNHALNVGSLTKNRLGKLIHDLDVTEAKNRKSVQGAKIMYYRLTPEKVKQVAENYRAYS